MPFVTCPVCKKRIDKAKGMTDKQAFEICARSHVAEPLTEDVKVETTIEEVEDERPIQPAGNQKASGKKNKRRSTFYLEH